MSWSTRTWQPTVRRDGPLIAVAAFFVAPSAFFLIAWYADYYPGVTSTIILAVAGVVALASPPLICYRLAQRAGRKGALWFALVLAGGLLAHWLPVQYLVMGGPLPPASYVALPMLLRRTLAATSVSLFPLVAGTIPVVLYGLAVGLNRPLAGVPPRSAVLLTATAGIILWSGVLFVSLLNPTPPLFVQIPAQVEINANLDPPPALPGEIEDITWERLLWRLHDGVPPGVTTITAQEGGYGLQLPARAQTSALLNTLLGPGVMEFVDAGDAPPAAGTEVSTTYRPRPAAEDSFETVLVAEDVVSSEMHWSGIAVGKIDVLMESDAAILTIHLNDQGLETLERFSAANPGDFLAMVLDNVVILSFPVRAGPARTGGESNILAVRRVDPALAAPIAAILRYGPLPLTPAVEAQ